MLGEGLLETRSDLLAWNFPGIPQMSRLLNGAFLWHYMYYKISYSTLARFIVYHNQIAKQKSLD